MHLKKHQGGTEIRHRGQFYAWKGDGDVTEVPQELADELVPLGGYEVVQKGEDDAPPVKCPVCGQDAPEGFSGEFNEDGTRRFDRSPVEVLGAEIFEPGEDGKRDGAGILTPGGEFGAPGGLAPGEEKVIASDGPLGFDNVDPAVGTDAQSVPTGSQDDDPDDAVNPGRKRRARSGEA